MPQIVAILLFVILQITQPAMANPFKPLLKGWTAGVGVEYPATSRDFIFSSGTSQDTGQKVKANFKLESKPSLHLFAIYSNSYSFGFYLGYENIPSSEIFGGKINVGSTQTSSRSTAYITDINLQLYHIGTQYRFDRLYFPANLILTDIPKYTRRDSAIGTIEGAGLGYSVGAGYFLSRHFSVESHFRSISFSYGEQISVGSSQYRDFGTGTSTEVTLGLKALF